MVYTNQEQVSTSVLVKVANIYPHFVSSWTLFWRIPNWEFVARYSQFLKFKALVSFIIIIIRPVDN